MDAQGQELQRQLAGKKQVASRRAVKRAAGLVDEDCGLNMYELKAKTIVKQLRTPFAQHVPAARQYTHIA